MLRNSDSLARRVEGFTRREDVAKLLPSGGIGIELGVAEGGFSERILASSKLSHLYSVDMYAGDRSHDVEQYKRAFTRLHKFRARSTLLRMRFDEALGLFPDRHFDFIYVDGYAHTGEEGGQTFRDWLPKLKHGGILAGDDYDPQWPLVVSAVDDFIASKNLEMLLITPSDKADQWSQFSTWIALRPQRQESVASRVSRSLKRRLSRISGAVGATLVKPKG